MFDHLDFEILKLLHSGFQSLCKICHLVPCSKFLLQTVEFHRLGFFTNCSKSIACHAWSSFCKILFQSWYAKSKKQNDVGDCAIICRVFFGVRKTYADEQFQRFAVWSPVSNRVSWTGNFFTNCLKSIACHAWSSVPISCWIFFFYATKDKKGVGDCDPMQKFFWGRNLTEAGKQFSWAFQRFAVRPLVVPYRDLSTGNFFTDCWKSIAGCIAWSSKLQQILLNLLQVCNKREKG